MLVEFFVEDHAHEQLLLPLVERVAREEQVGLRCQVRNSRGGHGQAMKSFERYQVLSAKGRVGSELPALLVVAIDGNCSSFREARGHIRRATRDAFAHMLVTACPDPHIERWYLADPQSFQTVVGTQPKGSRRKCARDHYKEMLATAVATAGHPPTLGGVEFGRELADAMDLFRAGKNDSSLRAFVSELREGLRRASESRGMREQEVRVAAGLCPSSSDFHRLGRMALIRCAEFAQNPVDMRQII